MRWPACSPSATSSETRISQRPRETTRATDSRIRVSRTSQDGGSITTNSDCLRFTAFNSTTTVASAAAESPRP